MNYKLPKPPTSLSFSCHKVCSWVAPATTWTLTIAKGLRANGKNLPYPWYPQNTAQDLHPPRFRTNQAQPIFFWDKSGSGLHGSHDLYVLPTSVRGTISTASLTMDHLDQRSQELFSQHRAIAAKLRKWGYKWQGFIFKKIIPWVKV